MNALVLSGGHIVSSGGSLCAVGTSTPTGQANFPRIAIVANGGDQSYGQTTTPGFVSYTASGPGTAAYMAVQQLGSFDIVFPLAASYEGWQASGRNKQNLVTAIKGQGAYPNVKNASRIPYVFLYSIMESSQNAASGLPYQTFTNLVRANNWWVYESAGGTGTILPSGTSDYFEVNYSYAWDISAGSAGLDQSICGNVYGTLSSSQGPAQSAATYFASALLTTNVQDSRFTGLSNGAAPNADALFLDNCFIFPNGGGNLGASNGYWDGINSIANATIAAYPSGASSLISRGQYHFFNTLQSYLATCNPGSTYYNIGNFGNYANTIDYGNTHIATANAMDNFFHGGLIEGVAGVAGSGWQNFMTFADILANIDYAIGYCLSAQLIGVQVRLPATDGSSTSTFTTGGVATTVSTGTALEYQEMRCMLCMTYMRNVYFAVGVNGYDYGLTRYYDEFGDDSFGQVNVKRGYLGTPVSAYVTISSGVHLRLFTGGVVAFNEWGNGPQTLTTAQIATALGTGTLYLLNGTQQPSINTGGVFSSYAMADGDGLILLNATVLQITNVDPLTPTGKVGTAYNKQMSAVGGSSPYTWALISCTPNTGSWLSVNSSGQVIGTPGTAETETIILRATDSLGNFTQSIYTLVVTP